VQHLEAILDILKSHHIKLNLKKYKFVKTTLVYLGPVVGNEELRIDLPKVEAIENWLKPKNVHELRNFEGQLNT